MPRRAYMPWDFNKMLRLAQLDTTATRRKFINRISGSWPKHKNGTWLSSSFQELYNDVPFIFMRLILRKLINRISSRISGSCPKSSGSWPKHKNGTWLSSSFQELSNDVPFIFMRLILRKLINRISGRISGFCPKSIAAFI